MSSSTTRVSEQTINSLVKAASYAVRGRIVSRSAELQQQLRTPNHGLPFDKIVSCNIGNPHALQQSPLSFMRDTLSLVLNPTLAQRAAASAASSAGAAPLFPADLVRRAERYLQDIPGVGAYSESQGLRTVREDVAAFLEQRDGVRGDVNNIFLTNGASEGVRLTMQTILRDPAEGVQDGVLTPIPQYPLYSALATLLKGRLVPYYLDEARGWSCSVEALQASLDKARNEGVAVRGLVVINPGNPTGQILGSEDMRRIINFCAKEEIVLFADEVYQENVWKDDATFVSFRKVAYDLGCSPNNDESGLQMISFHSVSKGFLGECGLRGGYFELFNIPATVRQEIYKLASISLCSNTLGQIATGLMVQPPRPGDESFPLYEQEKNAILESMRRRSKGLSVALNQLPGVSCTSIDGAMYAFPTITLPPKALEEAKKLGVPADEMYCMALLEQTGVVVVPGSGFGQKEGSLHFRTTILPPEESMQDVVKKMAAFHTSFLAKYA